MSHRHYLEQEVLTASPEKLQLLLIEGAIRHGQRAKLLWSQSENEAAGEALVRMQEIISQIIAGLSHDRSQPLVRQMAAIYAFLVRALGSAHRRRDEKSLDDALHVLSIERETWRQVCQQAPAEPARPAAPHFAPHSNHADSASERLSFEA
jgi:flagellar protein FliS